MQPGINHNYNTMAKRVKHGGSNALYKNIDHAFDCYLYKSCDLAHGIGWFCHVYNNLDNTVHFGFSKHSKFTAVRQALKN